MRTKHNNPGSIDDRVADLPQLIETNTENVNASLDNKTDVSPHHCTPLESTSEVTCEPMPSTEEAVECFRRIALLASQHMSASSYPGYESAPASTKRVIEALLDPEFARRSVRSYPGRI
jgi:hypothetical protein